jgi:hypothetical protein
MPTKAESKRERSETFGADDFPTLKPATVQEAMDQLLAARKVDGSSPRHVDDLESRLNRFAKSFQCSISSVTASDIHDFLGSLKLEPRTVNNYRTAISNLFTFARLKIFVAKDCNPLEDVPEFKEPVKPVPILTPDQLVLLLKNASSEFLPYLVIVNRTAAGAMQVDSDSPQDRCRLLCRWTK